MKKAIFILCLAICVLFAVSSVCAGDVNDTAIACDDADQVIEEVSDNETVFESDEINEESISSQNEDILNAKDDGRFSSLQDKINNVGEEGIIYLENDYTCEDGFNGNGIEINDKQSLTIDGKGYTINGDNKARIFRLFRSNVIFRNIVFINGNGNGGEGGAIHSYIESDISVVNCTFNFNSAPWLGGAISNSDGNFDVFNCSFNSNSAMYGGAISGNCKAVNCTFSGNTASESGGAISGGYVEDCTFSGNTAGWDGGAICSGSAVNCTFSGNTAGRDGGAISCVSARDCTFYENTASRNGGAINGYDYLKKYTIFNSIFINNHANQNGGAIFDAMAVYCLFEYNSAINGGAIYGNKVTDSIFNNNVASDCGGAICNANVSTNLKFNHNTAPNGDDTYNVTFFDVITTRFVDLNYAINNNDEKIIYLNQDYAFSEFDSCLKDGIPINRAVTIYGNGHTIDGNNQARIFTVTNSNVVFKDIVLVNGKSEYGGAINGKCTAINCTFNSNSAIGLFLDPGYGGAMSGGSAVNCVFNSNSANGDGGAMSGGSAKDCTFYLNSAESGGAMSGGSAEDCTFINNSAGYVGGAMSDGSALNCTFINNSAGSSGGAMSDCDAENCTFNANSASSWYGGAMFCCYAFNCNFINNSAYRGGGAIDGSSAENCTFINNSANNGGAMQSSSAWDCIFKNNHANEYGGAMYGDTQTATDCQFINNTAKNGGATYQVTAYNCYFTKNSATEYGGAMSGGSAENCILISNFANGDGGAMSGGSAWDCIFKNNRANENGGAMYGDTQTATDCQFINNTAKNGGATYQIIVDDCNFTKNSATEYGGAMYEGAAENCIFKDDKAGISGDNIYNTTVPKAVLIVNDFSSTFNSGDKLLFNLIKDSLTPVNNANITIRVYKNNILLGTYYALSGEGWVVNVDVGSYIAVCSVENNAFDVEPAYATLTISKADSTLAVNGMEFDYGSSGTTIVSYTGATGVVVEVLNHPNAIVNVKGNTITVSNLDVGTYTLSVTTIVDGNHNSVTKTAKIRVNKASRNPNPTKTTLTLKKVTVKKSAKKLVITATLKIKGKAAKGKIIKFKFNGKTYKAKTNKKGVAKITIKRAVLKKLKAGKKVTYQASYGKTTKKVTVNVKK